MVRAPDFLHLYVQDPEKKYALSWGEPPSTPVYLILRGGITLLVYLKLSSYTCLDKIFIL